MKTYNSFDNINGQSSIIVDNDTIIEVSQLFADMTEYPIDELLDKNIGELFKTLRLGPNFDIKSINEQAGYFLFTKSFKVMFVNIEVIIGVNERVYTIKVTPNFRLEDKLDYLYQMCCENITGLLIYSVPDFTLLKANQIALDNFPPPFNTPEHTIGKPVYDLVKGWKGSSIETVWRNIVATGNSLCFKESPYSGLEKGITYWDTTLTPIKEDEKVKYIVVNSKDVTERVLGRRKIEEQMEVIKLKNKQMEAIIHNMSDELLVFDKDGKFVFSNITVFKFDDLNTCTNFDELYKRFMYFDLEGNALPYTSMPHVRIINGEKVKDQIMIVQTPKGKKYLGSTGTPMFDNEGNFCLGILCLRDMTELVNQNEVIKQQKELLEATVENMNDVVVIYDKTGNAKYINAEARKMYPFINSSSNTNNVHNVMQCFDLENNPIPVDDLPARRVIRGEKIRNERVIGKFDDNTVIVEVNAVPVYDEQNNLISAVVTHHDITQVIEYEERLRKQNEELEAIIENMSEGLAVVDKNGEYIRVNKKVREYTKKSIGINTVSKTGGSLDMGIKYYDEADELLPYYNFPAVKVIKGERFENQRIVMKNGNNAFYFDFSATPIFDDNGEVRLGVIHSHEVTEQVKKDEIIRKQKEQLEFELTYTKLLQSISMELLSEDNIQVLYEKIIDAAMQIMHSHYASIQMLHPGQSNDDKLQLLAFRGFEPEAATFWEWVNVESGSACGEALRTGNRVIVPNVKDCDFIKGTEDFAVFMETGINAVQATPLYSRSGRMVGMLSTQWREPHQPSERELRLLDVLTRQAADLIEQKQADDKISWNKEKAEILYEVTGKLLASDRPQEIVEELCVRVMKFLKCDAFFNYLVDAEKLCLRLNAYAGIPKETALEIEWLDYGAAVCGCAARDGCRIVAESIQETPDIRTDLVKSFGIRAYACHPLMEQHKVIGTLSFGTKLKDNFNEDELALMNAVANQVAIAMNRIRTEQVLRSQQQLMVKAERERNEALQKAMEMKDEFLSLISHEFRTPLNVISTAIQALNFVYADEMTDKVKEYMGTIRQNTLRQLRLVNNLLDITRANAGRIKINKKNLDIVFLTKAITESVYQYASHKGIRVTFVSTFTKRIIGIDDEKYERIVLNLLSNAIKFTPEGKSIVVNLRSSKGSICVEVKDSGIGIPPSKMDIIFERFGQVDSSLSRQAEGTGIGLSLVKKFVEALGGSVSVKSKVGKGTTFTILFPNETAAEEQNQKPMIDLMNDNRLVQTTNIEFSDIYL